MTTIAARVLAHSISPADKPLVTDQLRYPRAIHAELLTHRVFSKNSSSSRAIPVKRLIEDVMNDPFIPLYWGKNQPGMQALQETSALVSCPTFSGGCEDLTNELAWLRARDFAVKMAEAFAEAEYHKQIVNRLLEPFAHINVVLSSTSFANFFHLRDHKDAEPHIRILAGEMKAAHESSTPDPLLPGQWHLPYVPHWERDEIVKAATGKNWQQSWDESDYAAMRKVSVARCASVSYKTVDGQPMTVERATDLYDKLVGSSPLHASPTEHQATPDTIFEFAGEIVGSWEWEHREQHGNFDGWRQFRKMLPGENVAG